MTRFRLIIPRLIGAATAVATLIGTGLLTADESSPVQFRNVADRVGLSFRHHSPFTPQRHTHLTMGSGVGWIDYDRDGWPDLYLCQGHEFASADGLNPPLTDQLLRNERGGFSAARNDLTPPNPHYSMGVTVADYDADGFDDLFVSCFGQDRIYTNNGDGTFSQRQTTSFPDDEFGAGCCWVDLNGDGLLDLFVVNYLQFDVDDYQLCQATHLGKTIYITCHPRRVPPQQDRIFLNEGNGGLREASEQFGLHQQPARQGLGVAAVDLDRDQDTDVYVANDSVENQLWHNAGAGKLLEDGLVSGTAINRSGQREAGMGLAVADVDANGYVDLFVTNFFAETNTLYRNEGGLFFLDVTDELGLAEPGRVRLGFGTSFLDADNDGWSDLFVANGHVHDRLLEIGRGEAFAQRALLLRNQDGRRFADLSEAAGDYFRRKVVGRGCSVADFDRDGRTDIAIQHLNGPVALLQNQSASDAASMSLELVGTSGNRSAIGALVDVTVSGRTFAVPRVSSSSYLSADEGRLQVGLGDQRAADVVVRWPYGRIESFGRLEAGRHHVLIEGRGESVRGDVP